MSEKPEALRLADMVMASPRKPTWDELEKAAIELRRQHADNEWLKADNERLRVLLTDASKAVWMNYDGDLLDRIEAALKEVPR